MKYTKSGEEIPSFGVDKKMDPELRDKWTDALRSGYYEQIRLYLCNGDGFCCMGVLGKVVGRTNKEMHGVSVLSNLDNCEVGEYLDEEGRISNLAQHLGGLNDSRGYSFDDIADVIEANL